MVRASFSSGRILGQYLAAFIISIMGIAGAFFFGVSQPFPTNLLAAFGSLLASGWLVFKVARNDYQWIETDPTSIRAKHLYTRRIVERPIADIEEIRTIVFPFRTPGTVVAEKLLGRVRGLVITFRDHRNTLLVSRSDPAMTNAKELMEAIIYRMAQQRKIQLEIVDLEGQPLVKRIY